MVLASVLLTLALVGITWFVKNDRAEYRLFKALDTSAERRKRYWKWVTQSWVAFAVPALLGLALLGRFDALGHLPAEFAPVTAALPALPEIGSGFVLGAVGGAVIVGIFLGSKPNQRLDSVTHC